MILFELCPGPPHRPAKTRCLHLRSNEMGETERCNVVVEHGGCLNTDCNYLYERNAENSLIFLSPFILSRSSRRSYYQYYISYTHIKIIILTPLHTLLLSAQW